VREARFGAIYSHSQVLSGRVIEEPNRVLRHSESGSTLAARTGAEADSAPSSPPATALTLFHPAVAGWFAGSFAAPTPAQAEAWPAIKAGRHTLIAAPTGSGKTLAAFLRPSTTWCGKDSTVA
jgi:superfamily II RNA helicase